MLGFMGCTLFSNAQPTLTKASVVGVPGDVTVYNYSNDSIIPGPAGPNRYWSIAIPHSAYLMQDSIVAPASTASYSVFSATSNVVEHAFGYDDFYYHADSTVYQYVGEKSIYTYTCSDPKDYLRFPFNYGDSYTDTWDAYVPNSTPHNIRTGIVTVTYDGFGTLATPAATVQNVARIHVNNAYTENNNGGIEHYQSDQYTWYQEGSHNSLVTMYVNHNLTTHYTYYWATYRANMKTLGVQDLSAPGIAVQLYPNPATDHVQIKVPANTSILKAELYLLTGALAETIVMQGQKPSNGVYELDTRHLAPGLYSIRLISGGRDSFETKKLLINQD